MEQILQKLSEIEITAQRIMQDADRTKAALSAEMEQQCKDLDLELEQETNRKIQALRDSLESRKDQELTGSAPANRAAPCRSGCLLQKKSPAAFGRPIPTTSKTMKGVI